MEELLDLLTTEMATNAMTAGVTLPMPIVFLVAFVVSLVLIKSLSSMCLKIKDKL